MLINVELHILVIVHLINYQHFNKKQKIDNNQENHYHNYKNLINFKNNYVRVIKNYNQKKSYKKN